MGTSTRARISADSLSGVAEVTRGDSGDALGEVLERADVRRHRNTR